VYLRPWEALIGPEHVVRGPLLVVAPHPDDEVIGCGGIMAAHLDAGRAVRALVLTDGRAGDPRGLETGAAYAELRRTEAREAARRIGGADVRFLTHPDGGLAASPGAVDDLAREIADFAPFTLCFPSPYEIHPDHRAASLHVRAALARLAAPPAALFAFEIGGFMPANCLLNVSGFAARKADAIRAYASQLAHMDIPAKVAALNRARTVNVADAAVTDCEAYCRIDPARLDAYFDAAEAAVRVVDGMGPLLG
jgi:LmbE family N-acetylglucosaminyl deacetylase